MKKCLRISGLVVFILICSVIIRSIIGEPFPVPQKITYPSPNGYDDFLEADRIFEDISRDKNYEIAVQAVQKELSSGSVKATEEEIFKAAVEIVSSSQPVFGSVEEGLSKKSVVVINSNFENTNFITPQFRGIARLMAIKGWLSEKSGNVKEAMDSYLDIIKFGGQITREGKIINHLVSQAVLMIGIRSLARISEKLSEEDLLKVINVLFLTEANIQTLRETYVVEMNNFSINMKNLYGIDKWGIKCAWKTNENYPHEKGKNRVLEFIGRLYKTLRDGLRPLSWLIEETNNLYQFLLENSERPCFELTDLEMPSYTFENGNDEIKKIFAGLVCKNQRTHGFINLLITDLAVKAYQIRNGHLPGSLDALTPDFLSEVPIDPFSGGLLHYKVSEPGYLLYSTGEDGKDQGRKRVKETTNLYEDSDDLFLDYLY